MPDLLNAVAEPRRRRIISLLWRRELSAGEIHRAVGDVTFGAISQHLRVLADHGVVAVRPEGRRRIYRVQRDTLGPIADMLDAMWADKLAELKDLAENEAATAAAGG